MFLLYFLYFIIRKLVMGCGVVCGVHPTTSSKHHSYSNKIQLELLQQIAANSPFLQQQTYRKFSAYLQQGEPVYILPVGNSVSNEQQIPAAIWQKWKILLYGLCKSDEAYKRSLGFESRNEKQQLTICQNKSESSRMLRNDSFHQAKGPTQYHSCFEQIQKDLNRTFDFKQETKTYFEKVLKRISNHFPTMGYTQGVNFVVGYLLIVGYSQSDAFWMFAHLAMNRKYLLLGLYEDGFPLAAVYTLLFKNLLKRYDHLLYNHIYNVLGLDDSVWIFKWFITYFIYSFPLQTIKFVWDLVIEVGGLGLVYYALGLVIQLKQQFMMLNDPCDASEFLQSLKSLQIFNEHVKMNKLVELAYEIKLRKEDFDGIDSLQDSFYKEHFSLIQAGIQRQERQKTKIQDNQTVDTYSMGEKDVTHHLHRWYLKIIQQRLSFMHKSDEQREKKIVMPEVLKGDYQDLQKSIQLLQDKIIKNESIKLSQKNIKDTKDRPRQNSNFFEQLVNEHPLERDQTKRQSNQLQLDNRAKIITRLSYDIEQQIDELQGEEDSNNGEQLQISQQYPISGIEDNPSQQPSISIEPQQTRQYRPNGNVKVNVLVSHLENCRKRNLRQAASKANNIKIAAPQVRSGLSLAGQNILNNLSGTNSHYSSIQSNNVGFKSKKHKQNNLLKYNNKNGKFRTEAMSQVSQPSNSSEQESSIDHRMDKDSLSGLTHRECSIKQRPSIGNDFGFIQRKTQQQIMIASHCPDPRKESDNNKDAISQIQIFNGEGLFKKKKRTNARNNIMTSLTHNYQGTLRTQSTANIKLQQAKHRTYNEEESLESVIELSTARKPRRQVSHTLDVMLCDIESIK